MQAQQTDEQPVSRPAQIDLRQWQAQGLHSAHVNVIYQVKDELPLNQTRKSLEVPAYHFPPTPRHDVPAVPALHTPNWGAAAAFYSCQLRVTTAELKMSPLRPMMSRPNDATEPFIAESEVSGADANERQQQRRQRRQIQQERRRAFRDRHFQEANIHGLRCREFEADLRLGERLMGGEPIRVKLTKTISFCRRWG
ncbi:unnamed protein product [Cladocopium goreaui]|uniref:C3H1-type domain-containing protein n=1 Tax=Cladocopium goreaui TaxID=2562237 RepID=A0A9P1BPE1_9DINO|nr:unnamed protein product [Cladocopium goreaui]